MGGCDGHLRHPRDIRYLLLVDGSEVINGAYKLKPTKKKSVKLIPHNGGEAVYLGKAPKVIEDDYGGIDYNATLKLAFDRYYMPLFDKDFRVYPQT